MILYYKKIKILAQFITNVNHEIKNKTQINIYFTIQIGYFENVLNLFLKA